MAQNNQSQNDSATVRDTAPATAPAATQWVMPRQKQVERLGDVSSPVTARYPQVRGGVCEYCGTMDGRQPSHMQYKLCPHYRGMQLRCTYCPASKDVDDVINHSTLNVAGHPNNPDQLVVWCDSFSCSEKHLKRFQVNS